MSSLRKTSLWVCLAAAALFAASCGDDDGGGTVDARPGADAASTGDAGAPTVYTVPLTKTEEVPVCTAAGAFGSSAEAHVPPGAREMFAARVEPSARPTARTATSDTIASAIAPNLTGAAAAAEVTVRTVPHLRLGSFPK